MTAINMMVQRKARTGFIISDGAFTDAAGVLLKVESKLVYSLNPRCPWAFAISGNLEPRAMMQELGADSPRTIKQLVKRLPNALRRALARNDRDYAVVGGASQASLIGCYWDFAGKRPQGFRMQSKRIGLIGQELEPFGWYDIDWSIGHHIDPSVLLGRPVDVTDPASFDPERDGVALVHAQRRVGLVDVMAGLEPGKCRIGGHIDMTEVTKAGVKVWHLHTYPDKLGELINPEKIAA